MSFPLWRRLSVLLASGLVAAAFALAALVKLADPASFATEIGNYRLVPSWVAALLALYLPWLELTLAGALVFPRPRRPAAWVALALLGVFCVALASAWARGLDIRCGCFGSMANTGVRTSLLRNLVLIALLAYVARRASAQSSDRDAKPTAGTKV